MRHLLITFSAIAVLAFGVAHAAPGFGSSSHRLGGDNKPMASNKAETTPLLEIIAAMIGLQSAASVGGDKQSDPKSGDIEECEGAKKAEAKSKPSTKTTARNDAKPRTGEPLYLAF
jgi:hypothetical protein